LIPSASFFDNNSSVDLYTLGTGRVQLIESVKVSQEIKEKKERKKSKRKEWK
jgi:hypothetical protein